MALHKGAVAQLQLYYFQSLTIARPMSAFKGSVQVDFCTGPVESLWKLVFTPFSLSTIYISNAESWICSISIISRWCIKILPHSTFLSVISPLPPLNYPLILPLPSLSAPLPSYPECSADRRRRLSWAIKRRRVWGGGRAAVQREQCTYTHRWGDTLGRRPAPCTRRSGDRRHGTG